MTSMPASRSARAMIFAPRSWPSRPGFATTTRILRAMADRLNDERVAGEAVLGGDAAQHGLHRLHAGCVVAGGGRGDREPALRAVRAERAQNNVVVHGGEGDGGDERDPPARGDEALLAEPLGRFEA